MYTLYQGRKVGDTFAESRNFLNLVNTKLRFLIMSQVFTLFLFCCPFSIKENSQSLLNVGFTCDQSVKEI